MTMDTTTDHGRGAGFDPVRLGPFGVLVLAVLAAGRAAHAWLTAAAESSFAVGCLVRYELSCWRQARAVRRARR
jgi:hypothetical protein